MVLAAVEKVKCISFCCTWAGAFENSTIERHQRPRAHDAERRIARWRSRFRRSLRYLPVPTIISSLARYSSVHKIVCGLPASAQHRGRYITGFGQKVHRLIGSQSIRQQASEFCRTPNYSLRGTRERPLACANIAFGGLAQPLPCRICCALAKCPIAWLTELN